jgi:acylphosphatase
MTEAAGSRPIRCRVLYSGRVQGVCFRATAQELSRGRAVVGFVRNLPDGRVELEAEGAARDVEDFLAAVERHFARYITSAPRTTGPARGDEAHFEIRY